MTSPRRAPERRRSLGRTRRADRRLLGYLLYQARLLLQSPPRVFAAAVGAIGVGLTIADLRQRAGPLVAYGLVALIGAVFAGLVIRSHRRAPAAQQDHQLYYRAYCPPSPEDNDQIERACCYFGAAAIDPSDGAQAVAADPFSTVVLRDGMGRAVGFADYYAFSADCFDAYARGRISAKDMFADHYLRHPEARDAEVLYLSTIFRYDFISDQSFYGRKESTLLVWALARLILTVQRFPPAGLRIVSCGDSSEGDAALRHYGFRETGQRDPAGNDILSLEGVRAEHVETHLAKYRFLGYQCQSMWA